MKRRERRRLLLCLAAAFAATGVAILLTGESRGIALYAYVLVLAAIAARILFTRLRAVLPATPPLESLLPRHRVPDRRVLQLEELARRHGVDLARSPARAHALVGVRTWELVRPDRLPPEDRNARGWSDEELGELVDELELI